VVVEETKEENSKFKLFARDSDTVGGIATVRFRFEIKNLTSSPNPRSPVPCWLAIAAYFMGSVAMFVGILN